MIGFVNKIIPFSSVDGPGNRTSIFLQGCNFDCIYCHNPETINLCSNCGLCVNSCKTNALSFKDDLVLWDKSKCCNCDNCIKNCSRNSSPKISKFSTADIIKEISNYRTFIQGITVSGGECTLQEEFLIDLFTKAKELGLTCFIDSNGSKDFRKMPKLLELCDGVMLDVKCFDKSNHDKYIRFDNSTVLNNLKYLADKNKLYEVRTVVVPNIFDNEETVNKVSEIIGISSNSIRYKLIKFRNLGVRDILKSHPSATNEYMKQLKDIAIKNNCIDVIIV